MTAGARYESDRSDGASPLPPSVLVGLIGKGIQNSRTPFMHECEGARQGLRYVYKLLDTDMMGGTPPAIEDILAFARRFGFRGVNVTYPYKQAAIPHLDEMTADAAAVGAVNSVRFEDGRAIGHNTDMPAFAASFRQTLAGAPHDTVLQLGAGGGGAAVAAALLSSGVSALLIHDIDPARADQLAASLAATFDKARVSTVPSAAEASARADGIVNATPVGMASLPGTAIDIGLVRPDMWVADIVYFPLETELLRLARAKGCRVMNGRGMAVHQAALAFDYFTGLSADVSAMGRDFDALSGGS
ncbi:MAG: shikimate dehydrogenase [Alphaproteobacteria bacterium]